jgi:hypothetical protein
MRKTATHLTPLGRWCRIRCCAVAGAGKQKERTVVDGTQAPVGHEAAVGGEADPSYARVSARVRLDRRRLAPGSGAKSADHYRDRLASSGLKVDQRESPEGTGGSPIRQ